MKPRKVIAYIAVSADGYIARSDGNVDWLNRPRPPGNYGMNAFLKTIDTILWGRKTYDIALGFGEQGGDFGFGARIKNYVFTHHPPESSSGVEFVSETVKDFAARIRVEPGKNIWMMGGAGIIGSFLDANELDEFIVHVIPIFIGEGIPLIERRNRLVRLQLLSSESYADGVVRLHYQVEREAQTGSQ